MAIFDVYDEDVISLLQEVDEAKERLQHAGMFTPEDLERLKRAFLPDRISDTLNIESIQVNPRLTQAVLEGLTISDTDRYAETAIVNVNEANLFIENAAKAGDLLSIGHISEINRRIEIGTGESREPGKLRQINVKITGSGLQPTDWPDIEKTLKHFLHVIGESRHHPLVKACFAHWVVSFVHPFENGNGRTARLVQDFMLIREGLLPVGIPIGRRAAYYEALANADNGDGMSLVRIVASAELAALDKALQVGSEDKASRSRMRQLIEQSQKRVENRDVQRHELWSRKVDVFISELTRRFDQWNSEDVDIKFTYALEEKPNLKKWQEIINVGWAHQTHLCRFELKQGRDPKVTGVWYAKRHRLDYVAGYNGELKSEVGIFLAISKPYEKFMLIEPLRDPYIELREVLPWDNGYRVFIDTKTTGKFQDLEGVHFEIYSAVWEMQHTQTLGARIDDFMEQLLRKSGFLD